jgi:hypothetical protein
MANPEQIEQELREYLALEKNLRLEDRLKYLMAIVNKHFATDKIDHLVNYSELNDIIGYAKSSWVQTTLPMEISRREVHSNDVNYVLVMEAFISYLNRNKLLKKLVKFDHLRRKL